MDQSRSILPSVIWQAAAILVLAVAVSLLVNQFRKDRLPLVGDWSPKGQLSTLNSLEEPVISLDEARALFLTGGAVFIDARPRESYLSGHIEGALSLPAEEFEGYIDRVMPLLAPDSLIIVYCDGESCTLSKEVAYSLTGKGYSHVRVLVNGWSVWQDAKLPAQAGGE